MMRASRATMALVVGMWALDVHAEEPAPPMVPLLAPSTAGVGTPGTASIGAGVATGWTGAPRAGAMARALWWPLPRVLVGADLATGAADLTCPSCTGALGRVALRANVLEHDALRVGVAGSVGGTAGLGPTGSAGASVVAEGGTARVRIDAAAQLLSTVDILEDARSGWESGLTVHSTPRHATRVGTVGPRFRPTVAHRVQGERGWWTTEAAWTDVGPIVRVQVGTVLPRP